MRNRGCDSVRARSSMVMLRFEGVKRVAFCGEVSHLLVRRAYGLIFFLHPSTIDPYCREQATPGVLCVLFCGTCYTWYMFWEQRFARAAVAAWYPVERPWGRYGLAPESERVRSHGLCVLAIIGCALLLTAQQTWTRIPADLSPLLSRQGSELRRVET